MLAIICPACGHSETDGFEVLAEKTLHHCTCDSCSGKFSMFFSECSCCMHDTVLTWPSESAPTELALQQLQCETCAQPLTMPDEALADL